MKRRQDQQDETILSILRILSKLKQPFALRKLLGRLGNCRFICSTEDF